MSGRAGLILALGLSLAGNARGSLRQFSGPMLLLTAEYTPYDRLVQPDLVRLFQEYQVAVVPCVRADQLGPELDRLYDIYEAAGIPILFWPLLPRDQGLYLNKHTTAEFLAYLDVIFAWAEQNHHPIEAMVLDIEPSNFGPPPGTATGPKPPSFGASVKKMVRDLDQRSFAESLPGFQRILDKLHEHHCLAIACGFPFVLEDVSNQNRAWEDLSGGPLLDIKWDYVTFMIYNSSMLPLTRKLGVDWDELTYLTYLDGLEMKRVWGDRAGAALGVTSAGEGQETVIYPDPDRMAPDVAALRAAGVNNVGIYDLKGILESPDPEAWLKMLRDTPAQTPPERLRARGFRLLIRAVGKGLELFR